MLDRVACSTKDAAAASKHAGSVSQSVLGSLLATVSQTWAPAGLAFTHRERDRERLRERDTHAHADTHTHTHTHTHMHVLTGRAR